MNIEEIMSKSYENLGHISFDIFELEDTEPDKRTKEHKEWKEKINFLFDKYNTLANDYIYKLLK